MHKLNVLVFSRRASFKLQKKWLTSVFQGNSLCIKVITDDILEHLIYRSDYIHSCSIEPSFNTCNPKSNIDPSLSREMIMSCRYLSQIPFHKALTVFNNTYYRLQNIFSEFKPDIFFTIPPDMYTIFQCSLLCNNRKIPFLSALSSRFYEKSSVLHNSNKLVCDFSIEHRRQFSKFIDETEKNKILHVLTSDRYDPWKEKSASPSLFPFSTLVKCCKGEFSLLFNALVGVSIALRYPKDSYPTYKHLNSICFPRINRLIAYSNLKKHSPSSLTAMPSYEQSFRKRKVLYFPLQFFPESTNQYYIDQGYKNIWQVYPQICHDLVNKGYFLVLKEHPFCVGMRDKKFYDSLPSSNLVFLDHRVSKSSIFSLVNCSLLVGSLLFEALSLNVNVVSLGQSQLIPKFRYNSQTPADLEEILQDLLFDSKAQAIGLKNQQIIYRDHCYEVLNSLIHEYLCAHIDLSVPVSAPAIRSTKNLFSRVFR